VKLSRAAIVLSLALVFVCGAVAGAMGYRLYTVRGVSADARPPRNPEEFRRRMMEDFRRRLTLNDDQLSKLTAIMDDTRRRFTETRATIEPEMHKIREEEQQRIMALLSPDQQVIWAQMQKEREARQRKKRGDFAPPPSAH